MKQKKFFVKLFSILMSLLLAGCSTDSIFQPLTPITLPSGLVIEPEAIKRLDAKLAQMTQDGTFSGSVLIAVDGNILLSKGYGLADRAQGIPNTPQMRFHLGSMTKQFTAMGILILQSQGKLSVQDPICNFFADCPREWQDITIHHLLTHTSGLSSQLSDRLYRQIEAGKSGPVAPGEKAYYLGLTSQWSLDTRPGEQYAYNNFGYILLANIIEEVSAQSYGDYLNQAIFIPLKMHNTGYPDGSSGEAKLYANHDDTTGAQFGSPPVSEGSGYLYSSSEDLFLLDQALYTDQLLPESELERMFEPYVSQIDYSGFGYGYGWVLGESQGQPIIAGAGGGEGSPFGTLIIRYPQDRLTLIVLANQYIDQFYYWGLISDELFGKKQVADTPATDSSVPPVCTNIGQTWTSPVDGMTLVCVPAGEFSMGSEDGEDFEEFMNEKPIHIVYLDAFWIDQTEVTNAMFAQFVAETNHQTEAEKRGTSWAWIGSEWQEISGADWRHPNGPETSIDGLGEHPVVLISWEDAKAYCQWAQRQLPSEAQWEKAARGTDGRSYPWGNESPMDNLANFADVNLNVFWADKDVNDGYETTAPVGSYPSGASPYGALDMAGNAWEWVNDWYDSNYYSSSAGSNPTGPPGGDYRVLRGGSWHHHWLGLRTSFRVNNYPLVRIDYSGFRCGVLPGK